MENLVPLVDEVGEHGADDRLTGCVVGAFEAFDADGVGLEVASGGEGGGEEEVVVAGIGDAPQGDAGDGVDAVRVAFGQVVVERPLGADEHGVNVVETVDGEVGCRCGENELPVDVGEGDGRSVDHVFLRGRGVGPSRAETGRHGRGKRWRVWLGISGLLPEALGFQDRNIG
ncbi:hypothetical protein ABZ897_53830 [Nonomuraea sp. NPDC046802]|uniref:hypothetical protein n=1 Tax=Nonomuraea sp. NPDC046802 TaxID=3154919 RepID=UPI0033E08CC4